MGILQKLTAAVYASSGVASTRTDPFACSLDGLSRLTECPSQETTSKELLLRSNTHGDNDASSSTVVRAVTLAGVLVPAPWATGGQAALTLAQAQSWYTAADFAAMAHAGINAVVIPIPTSSAFWVDHHRHNNFNILKQHGGNDDNTSKQLQLLRSLLALAKKAKLPVILQLVASTPDPAADDNDPTKSLQDAVDKTISMVRDHYMDTVLAVELPSIPVAHSTSHHHRSSSSQPQPQQRSDSLLPLHRMVNAARKLSRHVRLLVPMNVGQLGQVQYWSTDPNTFVSMSTEHTTSISDIASSNSLDDRMKMFYHESTACMQRAPIDYAACLKNLPVMVTAGFDLAIDNCAVRPAQQPSDNTIKNGFVDYGQCDRWEETIHSDWWKRHRQSFAERQLVANEYGLGWTFAAWKVWEDDHHTSSSDSSVIASPSQLYSFRAVTAAGLFPDLHSRETHPRAGKKSSKRSSSTTMAASSMSLPICLNPPLDDFVLGDMTVSPTPGPLPDCGNGWWNETIQDCSYWVPPPPCPVCEVCFFPNPASDADDGSNSSSISSSVDSNWEIVNMTTTSEMDENVTLAEQPETSSSSPELFLGSAIFDSRHSNMDAALPSTFSMSSHVVAFGAGVAMAVMISAVGGRVLGRRGNGRRDQYSPIPN